MDYKIRKRTRRSMTAVRIWLEHSLPEVYVYVAADTGLGMVDIKKREYDFLDHMIHSDP